MAQSLTRAFNARPLLWVILTLPGLIILGRYQTDAVSYGQVIHQTGDLSAQLLIFTLAVTPIRLTFRRTKFAAWLVRRRREFGVATFGYAAFHTIVYLLRKSDPALIWQEGAQPDLLTGWAALLILAILAVTSNDVATRILGRAWKALHRVVYLGAVLTFVHWVLVAFDPLVAYIHIGVLAAVEIWRLIASSRLRRT